MRPVGVGIVGAGDIGPRYAACLRALSPQPLRFCGIAGRDGLDALLADPEVELVLNLTPPLAHAQVTAAALRAGKHVYSEKPLAHDLESADALRNQATSAGLTLACAPATHLGPAQQAIRQALAAGELGQPVGGSATLVYAGPDRWHYNPAPIFGAAAGPLFDIGVYFVNAFVHLFGSVARVSAVARRMQTTRQVHAGPRRGETFAVSAPTHVSGWLEFESGVVVTLTTSFDSRGSQAPMLEVYGTEASVALPWSQDTFAAVPQICRRMGDWQPMAHTVEGWSDPWWAVGVIDTADALRGARAPRCHDGVARHVLEVLTAVEAASAQHCCVDIVSRCDVPPALLAGPVTVNFPALFEPTRRLVA